MQAEHEMAKQQLALEEAALATASQEGMQLAAQKQELEKQFVKTTQAIQVGVRHHVPMVYLLCLCNRRKGAYSAGFPTTVSAASQALEQQLLDQLAEQTSVEKSAQRTVADTKALRASIQQKEAQLQDLQAQLEKMQGDYESTQVSVP